MPGGRRFSKKTILRIFLNTLRSKDVGKHQKIIPYTGFRSKIKITLRTLFELSVFFSEIVNKFFVSKKVFLLEKFIRQTLVG